MRIIASIDRSAGNESIGDMWKETASFPLSATIESILTWVVATTKNQRIEAVKSEDLRKIRYNITITIDQSSC